MKRGRGFRVLHAFLHLRVSHINISLLLKLTEFIASSELTYDERVVLHCAERDIVRSRLLLQSTEVPLLL